MGYSTSAKNTMLDAFASVATYASLHSEDPGATGGSELTGGSYARQAITFGSASGGELAVTNTLTFNVPAGDVTHIGYWTAVSGGTFLGGGIIVPIPDAFASPGLFRVTSSILDLNATGIYAVMLYLNEGLSLVESLAAAMGGVQLSLADAVAAAESLSVYLESAGQASATFTDTLSIAEVLSAVISGTEASVTDTLSLEDALTVSASGDVTFSMTDTAAVAEALSVIIGDLLKSFTDSLSAAESLTVTPSGGATAVSDNFNRSDGDVGANWTVITGNTEPDIESNRLHNNYSSYRGIYWSADTFANDQYATLKTAASYYIRIRAVGTSIYADTSTDGSNWTNRLSVTDSAISSGSAGVTTGTETNDIYLGPAVRISSSATTFYWVRIYFVEEDQQYMKIAKMVAGTITELSSAYALGENGGDGDTVDDWTGGDI